MSCNCTYAKEDLLDFFNENTELTVECKECGNDIDKWETLFNFDNFTTDSIFDINYLKYAVKEYADYSNLVIVLLEGYIELVIVELDFINRISDDLYAKIVFSLRCMVSIFIESEKIVNNEQLAVLISMNATSIYVYLLAHHPEDFN